MISLKNLGLLFFLLPSLALGQISLKVDLDKPLGPISPYVYGANYGPLSTLPLSLLAQAQTSDIKHLRFPGRRWGDTNEFKGFHLDLLKPTLELLKADLSVQVRLEGGSPEKAVELVKLAESKNLDVAYWHIGNKPDLFDDDTTERYNQEWRAIAEAMLAYKPDIKLIGPDISQWNGAIGLEPSDHRGQSWLDEFLLSNGDLDVVAVHRYPFPQRLDRPSATASELVKDAAHWENLVPSLKTRFLDLTGRNLPVAVTVHSHWNSAVSTEASPDSLLHAIWWADVLGKLIQDGVYIVDYFDLQSNPGRGGMVLLGQMEVRPSYYVYQLYKAFQGDLLASSSSDPLVSIYAAQDGKHLSLIISNLHSEALVAKLELGEAEFVSAGLLDNSHQAAPIPSPFTSSKQLSLTAYSALLLHFALP